MEGRDGVRAAQEGNGRRSETKAAYNCFSEELKAPQSGRRGC